jgi:hypothetical protein
MIMFVLFGVAAALELCVQLFGALRWLRRTVAVMALILGGLVTGALVAWRPNVFTVLLALLSLYRLLNMLRVIKERMHEHYLRHATRTTTLTLMGLQLVVLAGWWAWSEWHAAGHVTWQVVAGLQLGVALMLLVSTWRSLKKTALSTPGKHFSDNELPTVTVAIPARNETEDLQQCLQSIIASDYPKLEVIVLDDCSQTRRTPEIIKQFAHDGVRFVQGEVPSDTWMPKNQAYDHLVREASGEYVLFCGADIRFAPHSIRALVTALLSRRKSMISVLPERQKSAYGHFSLIQAMRYWWELAPPRRLFNRPPVLSSCWIISRKALKGAGGFVSVARSIVPEAHFAKTLLPADAYSFVRAGQALMIESNKSPEEQFNTAVRSRYPQLHRRPEQVILVTLFELTALVGPFVVAIAGFWSPMINLPAQVMAALAGVLLAVVYELVVLNTKVNNGWLGLVGLPLAAAVDIGLLHYSMWKYEFSEVDWKGRNICVPAMHVIPHLPGVT